MRRRIAQLGEDVVVGLEQAPEAFRRMLSGATVGKTLVRVGDDPTAGAV